MHGKELALGGRNGDVFETLVDGVLQGVSEGVVVGVGLVLQMWERVLVYGCPSKIVFGDVNVRVNVPGEIFLAWKRRSLIIIWEVAQEGRLIMVIDHPQVLDIELVMILMLCWLIFGVDGKRAAEKEDRKLLRGRYMRVRGTPFFNPNTSHIQCLVGAIGRSQSQSCSACQSIWFRNPLRFLHNCLWVISARPPSSKCINDHALRQ